MEVEKNGLLPALFKFHPFHNKSGSFSLIWLEFALNFDISGCERLLSQILEIVPQELYHSSHNFVHQKKRYEYL